MIYWMWDFVTKIKRIDSCVYGVVYLLRGLFILCVMDFVRLYIKEDS